MLVMIECYEGDISNDRYLSTFNLKSLDNSFQEKRSKDKLFHMAAIRGKKLLSWNIALPDGTST